MAGKFAWEKQEEDFQNKKSKLKEAVLPTRIGLLLIAVSLALLLLIFGITPFMLFYGAIDFGVLMLLLGLYIGVAFWGEKVLGLKDSPSVVKRQEEEVNIKKFN